MKKVKVIEVIDTEWKDNGFVNFMPVLNFHDLAVDERGRFVAVERGSTEPCTSFGTCPIHED